MAVYEATIPQIDVNDKKIVVNDFKFSDGDFVKQRENMLVIETAKAVSDFYAEQSGYIVYCVEEGDELTIGDIVAFLCDTAEEAINLSAEINEKRKINKVSYKATQKAILLAQEKGVDLNELKKDGIIKEIDVINYIENRSN